MKKIVLNIIHAGFSGSAEWFEGLITLIVSKYNLRTMYQSHKKLHFARKWTCECLANGG